MKRPTIFEGAIGVAALVVFAAGVFVVTQGSVTTPVGLDEVLADFRSTTPAPGREVRAASVGPGRPEGATDAPAPTPGGTEPPAADRSPVTPPSETAAPSGSSVVSTSAGPTPLPAEAPASPAVDGQMSARPAVGVYTYLTTGGEEISLAGASHDYPERTYAAVTHHDGCRWQYRNRVVDEHVDERILCTESGQHHQLLQAREVEFFGKRDRFDIECDPPQLLHATGDGDGVVTIANCHGGGADIEMTRTTVGLTTVVVDGTEVDVLHLSIDSVMSGKVEGEAHDEHWVVPDTGLMVRWERTVDTVADAAFGARVRYQEEATFHLASLTPQT